VPRIEPTDRAIHDKSEPMPRPARSEPVAAVAHPTQPGPRGALARDDVRKLHAALHELGECRKLIDAAAARSD
jgi:hypothetical protein